MKRLEEYAKAGPSPAARAMWTNQVRVRPSAPAIWMPVGHANVFAARTGPGEVPI